MRIKAIVFFAALVLVALLGTTALAVPPFPGERTMEQPSGEPILVTAHGDEWFHWHEDADGTVVVQGEDGYWRYARYENGELHALEARLGIDGRPDGAADRDSVASAARNRLPAAAMATRGMSAVQRAGGVAAPAGPQKLVVLLISFSDRAMMNSAFYGGSSPDQYWNDKVFGDYSGYSTKTNANSSVNDYYKEISGNAFHFYPASETSGTANDGVISVTLGIAHPQYPAGNNAQFLAHSQQVAADALIAADGSIDYAAFDADGNGLITPDELHIVMILAGYEQACGYGAPAVWAHSTGLSSPVHRDNVQVGVEYTQQGEIHEIGGHHPATIGVLAHELGHSLGLPDLYDYGGQSLGIGVYSLMASGSWESNAGNHYGSSPTHLDAWCKTVLGFVAPATHTSGTHTVQSIETGGYNVIRVPSADPRQYFLLENRQRSHGYDRPLSNYFSTGGIAIYHIDDQVLDNAMLYYGSWYMINEDESHKAVDLEEANQGNLGYSQLDNNIQSSYSHLFRTGSSACNSTFHHTTAPNSRLYGGGASGVSITVNSPGQPSMTVAVTGYQTPEITGLAANKPSPQLQGRTIRWTCATTGGVGNRYKFDVYQDQTRVTGTGDYSANNYFDWKPAAPGSYTVTVSVLAGGAPGTLSVSADPFVILADTTVPVIAAQAGGAPLANGSTTGSSVAITVTDDATDDPITKTYRLNGGSTVSAWPSGGVFAASGSYQIMAVDPAGNAASFSFSIDNKAPSVSAKNAAGKAVASGSLQKTAVTVTVKDGLAVTKTVMRNNAEYPWPAGSRFTAEGAYVVSAADGVNNTTLFSFTIDLRAPVIRAAAETGAAIANKGFTREKITVTITDVALKSKSVRRNGRTVAWPSGSRFSSDGVYLITATDRYGRVARFTFTIDKTAPVIKARRSGGTTYMAAGGFSRYTVAVTFAEKNLSKKKATKNGAPVAWPSGGRFTASGIYTVTATDKAGNATTTNFVIDKSKPAVTVKTLVTGATVRGSGTATGGAIVAVKDAYLVSKAVKLGKKTIPWPEDDRFIAVGTYTVTAKDAAGNVTTFKFTVK